MTKKEKMELLLAKVAEEQKAAFVAELRESTTKEARQELLTKYNISLTDEEKEAMKGLPAAAAPTIAVVTVVVTPTNHFRHLR